MSFLGGAECSTSANPLNQFVKHTQDEKSAQRDKLVGRPGKGLQGIRSVSGLDTIGAQDNVGTRFFIDTKSMFIKILQGSIFLDDK